MLCSTSRREVVQGRRADDRHIERLNDDADDGTAYKVIWLARHGQGVHNVVCPLLPYH
jgi:hypothetical protein